MSKPRKSFRKLDGILLLDKPRGLSSNQALQRVRHLFEAQKAGHTGSLDPLATGLLPICFGEATKIAGNLLGSHKAYDAVARLGIVTDTDDAEGQPLRERPVAQYDIPTLDAALRGLTGRIQQVPPIYSALKRGGEPLYAKARRGETIEIEARPIDVHAFELLSEQDLLDGDAPQLRLHVECGSGTYVRSLVRDLGEALGCGAHVAELRRLWVDPFRDPKMWTLDSLQAMAERDPHCLDACLLPIEVGLVGHRHIELTEDAVKRFLQGQRIRLSAGAPTERPGPCAVFDPSGRAWGLADIDTAGCLHPQRVFQRGDAMRAQTVGTPERSAG